MFKWRESKREKVIKKRGIDFAEMTDVFDDSFAVYFEDYEHSTELETRFNIIGQTANYGLVFAVFIYAGEYDLYIVTERPAENWMVKEYEENRKRL